MDSDSDSEDGGGLGVESEGDWVHLTAATMEHYGATIPANSFEDRHDLRSVVFHSTLLYIHEAAFFGCINLKNVTFPPHLKWIGRSAFNNCTTITSMSVPGSVVEFGSMAFAYCTNMATFTFPLHLKTTIKGFGNNVFNGCEMLPAATKEGWKPIGVFTASDLTHLGDTLPDYIFYTREDIKKVTLPNSVSTLGDSAFYNCINLVDAAFPPHLQAIAEFAFNKCNSLNCVIIPESVREIGTYAFTGCDNLTTFIAAVPAPTTSTINVHTNAFIYCNNAHLNTISAPDNVVAALNEPYKACITLADLPPVVTAKHAKLQLHHYFWSITTHHHHFATTEQKACVKAVLFVSVRSANTAFKHAVKTETVRRSSRRTEQRLMLPEMPPEMWTFVLGMLRRTDLGKPDVPPAAVV